MKTSKRRRLRQRVTTLIKNFKKLINAIASPPSPQQWPPPPPPPPPQPNVQQQMGCSRQQRQHSRRSDSLLQSRNQVSVFLLFSDPSYNCFGAPTARSVRNFRMQRENYKTSTVLTTRYFLTMCTSAMLKIFNQWFFFSCVSFCCLRRRRRRRSIHFQCFWRANWLCANCQLSTSVSCQCCRLSKWRCRVWKRVRSLATLAFCLVRS